MQGRSRRGPGATRQREGHGSTAAIVAQGLACSDMGPVLPLDLPGPSTMLQVLVAPPPAPQPCGRKLFTTSMSMPGMSGLSPSISRPAALAAPAAAAPTPCCCPSSAAAPPPWRSRGASTGLNSAASSASAASVGVAAASSSGAAFRSAASSWQKRLLPSSACRMLFMKHRLPGLNRPRGSTRATAAAAAAAAAASVPALGGLIASGSWLATAGAAAAVIAVGAEAADAADLVALGLPPLAWLLIMTGC